MVLEFHRFFQVANPSKTLDLGKPEDRPYYIDFTTVRGGKIIAELGRTITRLSPNQPTCQLFTGHIGCGKSTELLRLKYELEQQEFFVVYFESSQDLVMADVDITDILLAIAHKVSSSLEKLKISLQPQGLKGLLQGAMAVLKTELDVSGDVSLPGLGDISASSEGELSLALGIGKITMKTKNSPKLREQLRQYLEPRTDKLLEQINKELLKPAIEQLKRQGKRGLVVIVDNLDRVDNTFRLGKRTQPEYLFVDRGEQLKQLQCHVVYTIPLVLTFSNDLGRLRNCFGVDPKLLPMVRVQQRDGSVCEEGMNLLRQMVLARAFPDLESQARLDLISAVFDNWETLERMCQVSGGHVRNLMVLLYSCLQKEDPPISRGCLEDVIRRQRDGLVRSITEDEWELLRKVVQHRIVKGEEEYQTLLRSMFVFEYEDRQGSWFSINPLLLGLPQLVE